MSRPILEVLREAEAVYRYVPGPDHAARYADAAAEIERLTAENADLQHDINRHLDICTSLTAENERLRAALTEAARLLNLEQIQGMSEKSVYTLRDIGLLVHQQLTSQSESREDKNHREMRDGTRCNGLCKDGLCNC